MNRSRCWAILLTSSIATCSLAQPAAGPTVSNSLTSAASAAGQSAGGPVQVASCKNCCSIYDFLGTKQTYDWFDQALCKSRLGQAIKTAIAPLARVLGLGPSLLSDQFAKGGGVMEKANELKKEEKKVPLKVQAIRYLATQNCNCDKEVVDVLLGALKDCAEVVRYEALKALRNGCEQGKSDGCKTCGHSGHKSKKAKKAGPNSSPYGDHDLMDVNCPDCDCTGCQCQERVIKAVYELLMERDDMGCLKERSPRVRDLATLMVEECLSRMQPPPIIGDAPAPEKEKTRPVDPRPGKPADPKPIQVPPKPMPAISTPPKASTGPSVKANTSKSTITEHVAAKVPLSAPGDVSPYVGKDLEKSIAPVIDPKTRLGSNRKGWKMPERRHLFGEVTGYGNHR